MENFGNYQLIRRIGSGGMAEVFLARTTVAQGLAKQLVIKKIHPAFARSRQFVAMFVDEARIALGLNHPNIVQVFDFGQVGQTFYLAMEYVEGVDLLRVMQQAARDGRRVPFGLGAYVVQQVAKGLDYAHRKSDDFGEPLGIVHRDISPQNVLVSFDGAVKIVDFGIARARDVQEEEGVVKGKFAYMAPEQARGELVDRRADVFSAGVVLFELCCGRPLFPGKGKEVLEKVRSGDIPRPREVDPSVPPELEEIVLRALTFDRDDRFQTGRDLQNALGQFQFHWAQAQVGGAQEGLVDSSSLAQFLSGLVPRVRRRPTTRPPTAPGNRRARARHLADGTDTDETDSSHPGGSRSFEGFVPGSASTLPRRELRERKPVFVIHGRIRGLSVLDRKVGGDAVRRVVDDFLGVARDIAFKHEAHVHDTGDDHIRIAVGIPAASEGDSSRALRLALALVEALDAIGHDVEPELRLAVGVQRGPAVVTRKRRGRFDYELGDATTEMARRLADDAQGADILIGGAVFQVARDDWNFEQLATIALTDPGTDAGTDTSGQRARVYRLRGPKERQQRLRERNRAVELIGRDLEFKALRDAYRDCLVRGSHRLLALTGDAGIGKGAVVNEFVRSIPSGEATILRAAGRAATSYTPFGLMADAARDILGLAEGAEPREVRKRLDMMAQLIYPKEADTPAVRELVDAACLLFGLRSGRRDLEPAELRQRLVQLSVRVEQRFAADKPMVVVAENVHFADEQSMAMCKDLLEVPNSRGLMIVLTSRPEPSVIKLAGEARADIMRMGELDAEERLELVRRRFVPGEDVSELAQKIVARAGGNPFFLCEMLDSLVDRGILVAEPEGSERAGLLRWVDREAPIHVPTSVEAVLAARIDQLEGELKDTLVHASVLGARFTASQLAPLVQRQVEPELAELVERGLLRAEDGGVSYAFRNEMTMTVAYRMVADDDRAVLHRAVADHLVRAPSYRQGQDDALVARHLELAGDDEDAAERYLRAAGHALHIGGNSDAFRQLTRALRLLPAEDHQRRFVARAQREEILRRTAQRPAQLREIDWLRKEAEALSEPAKLAMAHARLAQFYIDVGKAQAASKAVTPALQYAREAGDRTAEAEALRLRSSIARLLGRNEEALDLCDQALALLGEATESVEERALILNNRGSSLWNMDRLKEAIESYAESLVIYRQLGMPRQEARALNNMGIVFQALGEPEEALAHYKSSLKIDQRLGDRAALALKLGNIGQTYADLGDHARGQKYLRRALELTEAQDDRSSMVDIVGTLGQVALNERDYVQALALFERARELALETENRYQEIRSLIYLSLTHSETGGAAEQALELAERATEMARATHMPIGEVYGLAAQGLALADLGRLSEAVDRSRAAVELFESSEQSEGREQILSIHGRLCERAGHRAEAEDAIRRSHAEVERKVAKLHDPALRGCYLRAPVPAAVNLAYERLLAARD